MSWVLMNCLQDVKRWWVMSSATRKHLVLRKLQPKYGPLFLDMQLRSLKLPLHLRIIRLYHLQKEEEFTVVVVVVKSLRSDMQVTEEEEQQQEREQKEEVLLTVTSPAATLAQWKAAPMAYIAAFHTMQ
jgi:hypothetical protein